MADSPKVKCEKEKGITAGGENPVASDLEDAELEVLAKHYDKQAKGAGEKFGGGPNGLITKRARFFRDELDRRTKKRPPSDNPMNSVRM